MCQVLGVSRSGYYAWRSRPASQRETANQALVERIRVVHAESGGRYGSPRVYQALHRAGLGCSLNRVARLMRRHGIAARRTKRYRATTRANRRHPVAPNLLRGEFKASRPDEKWLADLSYVRTAEGWLYLAVVMDLFSRRIVGWSMGAHMSGPMVAAALRMAIDQRQPAAGLLHHSDRGSQYTALAYQQLLQAHRMRVSMNSVGAYYDNAPMESFFATLKSELVHHRRYRTRAGARSDIFYFIEAFYNRRRLHSALDYRSPAEMELAFAEQLT